MCKKIFRRDYQFPDWISKRARFVIYRLLDPNPETRMSLEALFTNEWFKKSLRPEPEPKKSVFGFDYGNQAKISGLNAFHIISMSSGLNLSGLFETTSSEGDNNKSMNRREKRFTSSAKMEVMEEKVKEVGGFFGFKVEVGKNNAIELVKGKVGLVVEVFEIVPSQLLLVDVKVVEGDLEFENNHWEDWKVALQDLVISWHNEESS
jgi:carbon catabolite-derepressing protein kinase